MDFFDLVKLFPVLESECRKERRNQYVRFVPRKILKNKTTFDSFISERVKEGVVKVGIVEETMIILLYHEGRLEITNPLAYTSSEIYAGDQTRFYLADFQNDPKVGERLVADLMTLNPVSVHKDKLAVEVLNLLESHRIDDLVVVDDNNAPVGIVDSQDLTRLKLL